jgi:mannose-6-phosphate isomerase-like protein (cupin superfamily)|tara:strand:+ start:204 stop:575 length:372 start_codon:yes stop_codon:yes gene_type:complete
MEKSKKTASELVDKNWGYELIFANTDEYCGKLLVINKGAKFSMHFHIKKDETWYVKSGKISVKYINTDNASVHEEELTVGDVWRNLPGEPHQVFAHEDSVIFEVSTTHFDEDSYRVFPGDSQT